MTIGRRAFVAVLCMEARVVLGVWTACMVIVLALGLGGPGLRGPAVLVAALAAFSLGALSFGHDFSQRTLSLTLSQPVRREVMLGAKTLVVAAGLSGLGALLYGVLVYGRHSSFPIGPVAIRIRDNGQMSAELLLPFLYGLFVTPWLTMICRSPLAGTVLSAAIPAVLVIAGSLAAWPQDVLAASMDTTVPQTAVLWIGSAVVCVAGALQTRRVFSRLEVVEGSHPMVTSWLPRRAQRAETTSRPTPAPSSLRPLGLLAMKELRLHQISFAVAALYVLVWMAVAMSRHVLPAGAGPDLETVPSVFGAALALLVGSTTSAEERQMGTIEWQALLPVSARVQWAIKVGIALCLVGLFAAALPTGLNALAPAGDVHLNRLQLVGFGCLTVGGIYVSSMSTSSVRAWVTSFLAAGGAITLIAALIGARWVALNWLATNLAWLAGDRLLTGEELRLFDQVGFGIVIATGVGLAAVALRFAAINHRSSARGAGLVGRQTACLATLLAAGFAGLTFMQFFVLAHQYADAERYWRRQRPAATLPATHAPTDLPR